MKDKLQMDRRRLAREISAVENGTGEHRELLKLAYAQPEWARVIGITGPPGAGKSTLVDALCAHWAEAGESVAVLAIDPSSPYSGGALLGDRIRMHRSAAYPGVFFRSLSSRGQVGGVSAACVDVVALLGTAGFRRVIVETVGAGQSDLDIMSIADCAIVVNVPGLGDQVQALKSGIMEIGDLYVVNKCDRPGASQTHGQIEQNLSTAYMGHPGVNEWTIDPTLPAARLSAGQLALNHRHGDPARETTTWRPPVLDATAAENIGIAEIAASVDAWLAWQTASGRGTQKHRERLHAHLLRLLVSRLTQTVADADTGGVLADMLSAIVAGERSPLECVDQLVGALGRG